MFSRIICWSVLYLIINPKFNYNAHNYFLFQESSLMALNRKYRIYPGTVFLVLSAVLLSGCSSLQFTPQDKPLLRETPYPIPVQTIVTTALPITTATPLLQQTTAATRTGIITENLPYGITISCPSDWMMEETGVTVTRDYGRDVVNIANFYSPVILPGRDTAGPNPDRSRNTILTVDIDEAGVTDFESYFNRVVLALQDEYGSIDITRHNSQLRIYGYKSYQMDFDTATLRGTYIFTKVGGTIYIFAFSNPTPYSSEVEGIYKSIIISP